MILTWIERMRYTQLALSEGQMLASLPYLTGLLEKSWHWLTECQGSLETEEKGWVGSIIFSTFLA